MKINIKDKQPEVSFQVGVISKKFVDQTFLIDTGFTGSIIFILAANDVRDYDFSDLEDVPKENWVYVADGTQARTFLANVPMIIDGKERLVRILIIEGKQTNDPLIGITFLRKYEKRLLLDFKKQKFELK